MGTSAQAGRSGAPISYPKVRFGFMRSFLMVCLASMVSCPSSAVAQAQSTTEPVCISLEVLRNVVLHEPVLIELSIWNRTAEPVRFDLGSNWKGNLQIQVRMPDGTMRTPPQYAVAGMAARGEVQLAAGGRFVRQYVLDEWVKLEEPGTYHVRIAIDSTFQGAADRAIDAVTTHVLEVDVTPFNHARLRQSAEWLAEAAITEPDARARADAVWALRHMDHPVAVPYLRRVFREAAESDYTIVGALLRIGTIEARDALIEMYSRPDPVLQQIITDALQRFELRQR